MAIVNRDLAGSEQCHVIDKTIAALATGVTTLISMVPFPAVVVAGSLKAFGLSGSPVYSVNLLRSSAAGLTLVGLGATITAIDGATFPQGISFTLGATVPIQQGDVLMINSGVANTAVTGMQLTLVIKALQDVRSYFNVQVS